MRILPAWELKLGFGFWVPSCWKMFLQIDLDCTRHTNNTQYCIIECTTVQGERVQLYSVSRLSPVCVLYKVINKIVLCRLSAVFLFLFYVIFFSGIETMPSHFCVKLWQLWWTALTRISVLHMFSTGLCSWCAASSLLQPAPVNTYSTHPLVSL